MRKAEKKVRAFSLVEVVLALGVCVFCLLVLQGMFLIGVNASHESIDDIQASNIASLLIAQRRANPTNTATIVPSLIPALTATVNNSSSPLYLTEDGQQTNAAAGTYRLIYSIQTNTFNVAQLGLTISAPANAASANAKTRYDVLTYVNLP